ncbi:MAG: proteobacterial dedicated sortase system histidine kinase, partial [Gammaproteobacteria bacterium]|nr:proteobacterial dedicated sortase system histidine kinase [Gammaproteobacteria bacterium]
MEKSLRIGLENSLMGAARALAGAMHDRPALFEHSHRQPLESGDGLYLFNLEQPIQLDGYPDDWEPLLAQTQHFGNPDITQDNVNTDPLSFSHLLGKETYHLYALFLVRDKRIIYRSPETSDPNRADHLRLVFETSDGRRRRFILNTSSPGWVNATEITGDFNRPASLRPEISIKGEWQETADGYNLEVRIPLHMVGSRMAIAIVDVDDDAGDPIPEVLGTTNPTDKDGLTTLISPSPEIENLIRSLGRTPGRRVHVLDANGRILTQGGTLLRGPPATPAGFFHSLILSWPDENAIDGNGVMTHLRGEWINTALGGKPSVSWRAGQEKEMVIVSAAHPILGNGRILGGVVVEETTHSIQTVQRQALGDLFNTTLVVVSIGTLSLLFFANRLSGRIRRLRDSTDAAVDPYGRITGTLVPSTAADEIGDLSRCYAVMIERLRQHHQYLETMAGRLSHELRTPLAVVRSSLDNLELNSSTEDPQLFVTRAKQGVERLSTIITQMSEASRL